MDIYRNLESVTVPAASCAIGMFDGVHIGHKMVLEQAIRFGRIHHLSSVVFTFDNHPQSVISQSPTPLLSTTEERLAAFERFGFDAVLLLDFTPALKSLSADDFVSKILMETLHVKAVSIGYDHRFGKGRQGDGAYLKLQGEQHGFDVSVVEPVQVDQQIVSSTLIRKLLSYGDLDKANQLLGRPYTVTGKVISGVGRGRQIGFPTANLEIASSRLIPAQGVYAGLVDIAGGAQGLQAVCNIGVAPTFGDQMLPRVEVHLLDNQMDLYHKTLTFHFHHHLRSEQAFPSVNALIGQLEQDCAQAKDLLKQGISTND